MGLSRWWYSMLLVHSSMYSPPSPFMGASTNTTVRKVSSRQLVAMNLSRLSQRGSSPPVKMHHSWHTATRVHTAAAKMLESSV